MKKLLGIWARATYLQVLNEVFLALFYIAVADLSNKNHDRKFTTFNQAKIDLYHFVVQ